MIERMREIANDLKKKIASSGAGAAIKKKKTMFKQHEIRYQPRLAKANKECFERVSRNLEQKRISNPDARPRRHRLNADISVESRDRSERSNEQTGSRMKQYYNRSSADDLSLNKDSCEGINPIGSPGTCASKKADQTSFLRGNFSKLDTEDHHNECVVVSVGKLGEDLKRSKESSGARFEYLVKNEATSNSIKQVLPKEDTAGEDKGLLSFGSLKNADELVNVESLEAYTPLRRRSEEAELSMCDDSTIRKLLRKYCDE